MRTIEMGRVEGEGAVEFRFARSSRKILIYGEGRSTELEATSEYKSPDDINEAHTVIVSLTKSLPKNTTRISFWTAIKFQEMPREMLSELTVVGQLKPENDTLTLQPPDEEVEKEMRLSGLTFAAGHTVISPKIVVLSDGRVFASARLIERNVLIQTLSQTLKRTIT